MAELYRVWELTSIGAGGGQRTLVGTFTPATQSEVDKQAARDLAVAAASGNPRRTMTRHDE